MINVIRLYDLEKKFKRYHGWSGGDGIFCNKYKNEILWYFSDTFVGESTSDDKRINFDLINNSLAISNEELSNFDFIYPRNPISSPFIPLNDGYFWLEDGIIIGDKFYIYALNMENDIFSDKIFQIKGVSLIELDLPFKSKINYKVHELFFNEDNIILGTSILKENDYYFIFGYINEYQNKKLILARTKDLLSQEIEYLQFDGSWEKERSNLMILKERFSSEFKVIKIKNEYYIAYTKDSVGKDIYLIKSDNITSPFDKEILVYSCQEHSGNIITYNSKIMLALTNEEEMIISYNVNTLINEEHVNLDIYRPRFIKIKMEDVRNEFSKIY